MIFKFSLPDKFDPLVPVFFILCQHEESKKFPHFQLQVPHGDLGKTIQDEALRCSINGLKADCDRRTAHLREKGLKSIALERELSEADRNTLLEAIGFLVEGLRDAHSNPRDC